MGCSIMRKIIILTVSHSLHMFQTAAQRKANILSLQRYKSRSFFFLFYLFFSRQSSHDLG